MSDFHPLRSDNHNPSEAFAQLDGKAELRAKSCEQAKVPDLNHLKSKDYDNVYEPAEDTYLLLDGILHEIQHNSIVRADFTLEIGCGTGVATVYLASLLKEKFNGKKCPSPSLHFVTDINPFALNVAQQTANMNGIDNFEAVQCDLASDFLPRFERCIDVIIFNPPYVPTTDDEVGSLGIEASWAGGTDGRIVVDRAIPQIAKLLRHPTGTAYLITVDDNIPEELAKMFRNHGLSMEPLVRRRSRNEYLSLQKISWIQSEEST